MSKRDEIERGKRNQIQQHRNWNQNQWCRETKSKLVGYENENEIELKCDEIENRRWNRKRKSDKKQGDEIENKNDLHYLKLQARTVEVRWRHARKGSISLLI